jgi:hypothetical protein
MWPNRRRIDGEDEGAERGTVARIRMGAEVPLRRLRAGIVVIEPTFPELALPARRRAVRAVKQATTMTRTMSAAAYRAVSDRMKLAERRKVQAKVK